METITNKDKIANKFANNKICTNLTSASFFTFFFFFFFLIYVFYNINIITLKGISQLISPTYL